MKKNCSPILIAEERVAVTHCTVKIIHLAVFPKKFKRKCLNSAEKKWKGISALNFRHFEFWNKGFFSVFILNYGILLHLIPAKEFTQSEFDKKKMKKSLPFRKTQIYCRKKNHIPPKRFPWLAMWPGLLFSEAVLMNFQIRDYLLF